MLSILHGDPQLNSQIHFLTLSVERMGKNAPELDRTLANIC